MKKLTIRGSTSKLPKSVQDLVCMIFDVESMKKAMKEFEVRIFILAVFKEKEAENFVMTDPTTDPTNLHMRPHKRTRDVVLYGKLPLVCYIVYVNGECSGRYIQKYCIGSILLVFLLWIELFVTSAPNSCKWLGD